MTIFREDKKVVAVSLTIFARVGPVGKKCYAQEMVSLELLNDVFHRGFFVVSLFDALKIFLKNNGHAMADAHSFEFHLHVPRTQGDPDENEILDINLPQIVVCQRKNYTYSEVLSNEWVRNSVIDELLSNAKELYQWEP